MPRFLTFLSSLLLVFASNAQEPPSAIENKDAAKRYSFEMETSKGFASGILIIKEDGNYVIGSMINEFGVSVVSFSYNKTDDKIKLHDVIGFLNKWYIKNVLKEDIKIGIHYLMPIPLKKEPKNYSIQSNNDGSLSIVNLKRDISYSFSPLVYSDNYDTEE